MPEEATRAKVRADVGLRSVVLEELMREGEDRHAWGHEVLLFTHPVCRLLVHVGATPQGTLRHRRDA